MIAVLDGLLLAGCILILLGYQRRTERQAGNSAFRAMHDPLTGLPNRTQLLDRLGTALARWSRDPRSVASCCCSSTSTASRTSTTGWATTWATRC